MKPLRVCAAALIVGTLTAINAPSVLAASAADPIIPAPAIGMALSPSGEGHVILDIVGGVFTFGDARYHGSVPALRAAGYPVGDAPSVGIATTPAGDGYWILDSAGGMFTFGDARFYGSVPALRAAGHPVGPAESIAMASTKSGEGYWVLDSAGGMFTFGDARFYGSVPALRAAGHPVGDARPVGIAPTPTGNGYWILDELGGVFAFGDAQPLGSLPGLRREGRLVGGPPAKALTPTPTGNGYWVLAANGGVFSFGDAQFYGAPTGTSSPAVGMATGADGSGYRIATADGRVYTFGTLAGGASTSRNDKRTEPASPPAPGKPPAPTTTTTTTSVPNPDPGPSGDGTNLAPNPSFESDPAVSYFTNGDASFAWASDAAYEGSMSLRVVSSLLAPSMARWLSKTDAIAAAPGATYEAGAMFRTSGVTDFAVLMLNFWDADRAHLGSTSSVALSGTDGWTPVSVSAVAPANAAFVRVEFRLVGLGTLWADNVSVRQRATTTTTTAPTTTTTTAPTTTTTTAPTTTTTTAPTTTDVPFAGPGTVGHAASIPGVHAPAELSLYSGDLITSRDGQVISGLEVTGEIYVKHRNVVVEDVRTRAVILAVDQFPQASVTVRWSTIGDPMGRTDAHDAVGTGNFTLYRSEVFGAVDLLKLQGGYAVVEESWIHDGIEWEVDWGQNGGRSHVDFLQVALRADVTKIRLLRNYFDAWVFRQPQQVGDVWRDLEASYTATGVLSIFQHDREFHIDDVLVQGNVFNGDAYTYFHVTHDADDPPPSNVRFLDNVIYRNYDTFGKNKLAGFTSPETIVWDGNTDQNGQRVAVAGTQAR